MGATATTSQSRANTRPAISGNSGYQRRRIPLPVLADLQTPRRRRIEGQTALPAGAQCPAQWPQRDRTACGLHFHPCPQDRRPSRIHDHGIHFLHTVPGQLHSPSLSARRRPLPLTTQHYARSTFPFWRATLSSRSLRCPWCSSPSSSRSGGRIPQHRKLARWTFPIWLYVSATGVITYVMLRLAQGS